MKAARCYKKWVNALRRWCGKPNGCIPCFAWDNPVRERQSENCRKSNKHTMRRTNKWKQQEDKRHA